MARRPSKSLEEQLLVANRDLTNAENCVKVCKQNIANIERQIEERDMREAYALLKQNNISICELQEIVSKMTKVKVSKKTA